MQDLHIVLYTLQYSYVHGAEKENLSNNQKFLEVIIISVILVTLKLASRGYTVGRNEMLVTLRG